MTAPIANDSHRDAWYYDDITRTAGETPLVKLRRLPAERGVKANVLVKLEYFNPSGSVKDRMAIFALDEAVKRGDLKPGGTIIEATSGNTGAAVAMYAAAHGFRAIITISDKMSKEKIDTLRAYGAEVHVCPAAAHPDSAEHFTEVAKRLEREIEGSFFLGQFWNMDNPRAHYELTGPEIWRQTGGRIDVLVGGVGTGGTMSGTGKFLKEQRADIHIVAADPIGSIYHEYFKSGHEGQAGAYLVEGIGDDILCPTMDFTAFDEIYQVNDKDCFTTARDLTRKEGLLVGGSSGAAVHVALEHARDLEADKTVVVILPDHGSKYVSKIFNDEWMREKGMLG